MKLIYKELLLEYGFFENNKNSNNKNIIISKKKMDIILKNDTFCCFFQGKQIELKNLTQLRKLYKEINGELLCQGFDK